MTFFHRTTLSTLGNSSAVILPKKLLNTFNIPSRSKIDLFETDDGILIKPTLDWTAENQTETISDFVAFALSTKDSEPLPENFIESYCRDKCCDKLDFTGLE